MSWVEGEIPWCSHVYRRHCRRCYRCLDEKQFNPKISPSLLPLAMAHLPKKAEYCRVVFHQSGLRPSPVEWFGSKGVNLFKSYPLMAWDLFELRKEAPGIVWDCQMGVGGHVSGALCAYRRRMVELNGYGQVNWAAPQREEQGYPRQYLLIMHVACSKLPFETFVVLR